MQAKLRTNGKCMSGSYIPALFLVLHIAIDRRVDRICHIHFEASLAEQDSRW